MNLIACDGQWTTDSSGAVRCTGTLQVVASDQINAGHPGITSAEINELMPYVVLLFATVFVIRVAGKAIK
ncbi:hypothetical protein HW090_02970 [Pseudomonas sp. ABC1]|uniref:hypothetical protein n=1 Tax=Pseudomonas sp. ABC1 TaxID=2748080 RepID=UPI0015C2C872|nr:hypothetical protein [Pseudomonas sp. ABC1]QLF92220.1 hypothetical protein HW090_02970 [Pseudomonas sp. ABC1]